MKKMVSIFLLAFIVFGTIGCSAESKKPEHLYDNAKTVDSHSGSGDVIGKISVIETKSENCTDEVLVDWYNNYVSKDEFDYYIIKYSDRKDTGIWSSAGIITKDVQLEEFNGNSDEWQMSGTGDDYIVKDGKLEKF